MKILMKKPAAGICCGVSHMSEALSGDESDHSRPDRIIGRPEEKQIAVYIEKITHSQDIREYQEAFRRLSGEAEKASGLRTQRAVLTVPAGFRSVTRNKLYEAAENAGIEILDILNEPTAAMIYYNAQELGRVPFEEDAVPEQEWLAGEAVSEETDFAHGCDFADVAAKSSSAASKSECNTMFWEEILEKAKENSVLRKSIRPAEKNQTMKDGYVALVLAMHEENMDLMALYICQGDIEEITSASDLHFGGKDWTQAFADRIMEKIQPEDGTQNVPEQMLQEKELADIASEDILKAAKTLRDMMNSSRSAAASISERYERELERISHLRIRLEELEDCSRHLTEKLDRKLRQFQNQLYEREVEGVDRIFCIGEAVRIPQIHRLLNDRFPGVPVEIRQPEKAALKGALLYAEQICAERDLNETGEEAAEALISREQGTARVPVNIKQEAERNLKKRGRETVRVPVNIERGSGQRFGKAVDRLHRICLRDIGIEAMTGDGRTRQIFQMIPKNGQLIFVRKMTFLPQAEDQKRIAVRIYETENRNNYADPASLEPEALTAQCMMPVYGSPGRKTRVDIRMKMDEKGLLTVTARTNGMNGYQTLNVIDYTR